MAAALAADSSDSLTADLFDCAVCMEDMSDRKPKNLTCGHSFCGRCLENIAKGNKSILCPTCRMETVLPEDGVSGLPMNLFISKVKANVSGIIMRSSILCGICLSQDRHTNAAHICTDCNINMCEPCRDYHLKMEIFNDHKFTLLHSEGNLCSDHSRVMEYICLECKKGLCVHCTMHNSHQAHTDQVKQLNTGMDLAKKEITEIKDQMREKTKIIQDFACCLVSAQSLEITEFSCLFDALMNVTDKYIFLQKWQTTYPKLQGISNQSTTLASSLAPILKATEKPDGKTPNIKVKPVHISTFDEHLGSPGEVAFLEDYSIIYLDDSSKAVTRLGIHHGILANICLPRKEEVTCLAVRGKYFYLGGNKHVMKIPMRSNTEPSEYIRLPQAQKNMDQLFILKDGTLMMKDKHKIRLYNPESKQVETNVNMVSTQKYTYLTLTADDRTTILTKPVDNQVFVNKNGKATYFGVEQNISNPMTTLVIENILLVADYGNSRVIAFDINKETYLGEMLNRSDGIKWPVGLAYKAPLLCVTESNVSQNWSFVNFFKWIG